MDARTLEIIHKRRYPGSLLTGARLKELTAAVELVADAALQQLIVDIRDGVTEFISLYLGTMPAPDFALLLEMMRNQPMLLVNIDLGRNSLTSEQGVVLAATLKCLPRLESLSLDYNQLGDVGVIAIADLVMCHKNLRSLRIRYNQIGEPAVDAMVQAALHSHCLGALDMGVRLPGFVTAHLEANRLAFSRIKTKPFKIDIPKATPKPAGTGAGGPGSVGALTVATGGPARPASVEESLAVMGVRPVAFVLSNNNYKVNHLRSVKAYRPEERADAVSDALAASGFFVSRHKDLGQTAFMEAVSAFQETTGPETICVFYYSGHGCEATNSDGSLENYLVPVDERGVTDYHMASTAVSLSAIMAGFGRQRCGVVFIVLDVCISYPLSRHIPTAECVPSAIGNVVINPDNVQEGMFLLTPCRPGTLPPGGVGDNGLFVRHLLRHIVNAHLDILALCRRVERGVSDDTKGQQRPFTAFYCLSPEPMYLQPALPMLCSESDAATLGGGSSVMERSTVMAASQLSP